MLGGIFRHIKLCVYVVFYVASHGFLMKKKKTKQKFGALRAHESALRDWDHYMSAH